MPYFISDQHPECDSWSLLKEDGELIFCHPDKEAAINHMVAISLEEGIAPGGEYTGETFRSIAEPALPTEEVRQVDLTPPAYMRAAARRGVELYEEGRAGDGVTEQTIREARAMAAGNVTADKYQRIAAWIARHLPDLEAEANQPGGEGFPGPGAVGFYLWGAVPTPRGAERTRAYAESITNRIEAENEGRATGEALSKLELRSNPTEFEIRDEGEAGMRFTGYAAVFNSPSSPLPFTERIAPGAFRRSLRSRNDVKLLWNHDTSLVLGSSRAGTVRLEEDEKGLRVEALLPNTTAGRDAAELLRRGDVDGMSFGFTVPQGGDSWSADGSERTLKSVRLHEISITPFPAYQATAGTASVRGLDKVAKRAEVDADSLADALVKLETGEEITTEELTLLDTVIQALKPKTEEPVAEVEEEPSEDGKALLELKKKKLAALMKAL